MESKNSFILYCDLIHTVEKMPDDKAGELFKHILKYVNDLNPETDDLIIQLTFEPIKQQLKRDLSKWKNYIEKQKVNGSKGGRPKNPTESQKTQAFSEKPKKADNVSVSVNDNVNESDIKKKFVLDLSKPNITYNEFIDKFNLLRKSKFSNKDNKAKGQFNARIKEGKTIDDILTALQNAMKEKNHIESGFKYLTPEFITRSDKLEMFLNSGNTETEKQTQPPPKEPDGFRDRVDHNEMIQEDWDYVNLIKKLYNKRIV